MIDSTSFLIIILLIVYMLRAYLYTIQLLFIVHVTNATGCSGGNEVGFKPVTASLALLNANTNPLGDEGVGSQEALHFSTTGQLKKVSVRGEIT